MDSDYEERGSRDEELSKLRSCSASPSALSTASSGSPLVRGASGGATNKRPAPTSIAAAQLQCQQQRQLEFANQLLGSGAGSSKKNASGSKQWQIPVAHGHQMTKPPSYSAKVTRNQWSKESNGKSGAQSKSMANDKSTGAASGANGHSVNGKMSDYDESKSRGYNVAKSIAYRAYRFNEFWSVNKMRYMNLLCLLMTLLCLVTILLLSNSGSSNNNNNNSPSNNVPESSAPFRHGKVKWTDEDWSAARKRQQRVKARLPTVGDEANNAAVESFDSLDSQPLQSSSQLPAAQQMSTSDSSNDNQLFDDFSLFSAADREDARQAAAKFRRKSESDKTATNSIERETEETTTSASGDTSGADFERQKSKLDSLFNGASGQSSSMETGSSSPGSLIELLLSQLFNNDMELGGSLFKAIKRAANNNNGTNGNLAIMSPPVIRRSKNGATIIISSSGSLARSNDSLGSPFATSLIEKLLPPIFRPISFPKQQQPVANSDGTANSSSSILPTSGGVATITIGAEPIFASGSSSGPMAVSRILSPFAALDPFGSQSQSTGRAGSLFMEPMGFRSPFGPMFSPPPVAFPPPGLLSMMMRPSSSFDADQMDSSGPISPFGALKPAPVASQDIAQAGSNNNKSSSDKNDTLISQASQQQTNNSNSTLKNTADSKSPQPVGAATSDPDVETFDLSSRPYRMHNFYPRTRPSGSMLVFSSSSPDAGPSRGDSPFPFSPFMALPPPQMMLIGAGGSGGSLEGGQSNAPINPILRTILSNVMSDLSSGSQEQQQQDKNKTERQPQQPRMPRFSSSSSSSNNIPHWSTLPELMDGDDWPGSPGNGPATVDERWDEQGAGNQQSSKHLRARHRDEDMDSAAEASDFVTGLQLDQPEQTLSQSPFGSILSSTGGGGLVSGTIRQTIRGPGMSVERIIEVPSSRVQHVAAGVRSQSLSRSDMADDSSESSPSRPTLISGSPFFMRSAIGERMSAADDFAGAPMPFGFISRLLSDISRRSEHQHHPGGGSRFSSPQAMKSRALLDEDLEEGDSSQSSSNKHQDGWPKIRFVGGVRIKTNRPPVAGAASNQQDTFALPSNHLSQSESSDEKEQNNGNMAEERKLGASFEDTMNSMEDRLNHVLSAASHHTFGMNHKLSEDSDISVKPLVGIIPVQRTHQAPTIASPVVSSDPAKQQQQQQQQVAVESSIKRAQSGNPFTSPSSPLFGFPTSSIIQPHQAKSNELAAKNDQDAPNAANISLGSNRQQRSFTYHSNNEVAPSMLSSAAKRDHPPTISEPIARSRFIPLQSPPAGVVMGRRLDDGPAHDESSAIEHHPQHRNHQSFVGAKPHAAVPANFEDRNKLFGEARGFTSSVGANEGFRTIVV